MRNLLTSLLAVIVPLLLSGCGGKSTVTLEQSGVRWAEWFDLVKDSGGEEALVILSPYDGSTDTLKVKSPMKNFICMSSSYIAYLDAIGADSLVTGVSGIDYISDPEIRRQFEEGRTFDVGYDANPDYERIVSLSPDLLVCYMVSSVEPPFLKKLRSLGVPVLVMYEHLENHPLARAEYVKLFGYLTGREEESCEAFGKVESNYLAIRDSLLDRNPVKVLLNIPYGDQWYVPGGDNYMTRLVQDAGGEDLGAVPRQTASSVISMEKAYTLSLEADFWLNTGWCDTKEQLFSVDPVFRRFPVDRIYNNTLRVTPGGGNDFWESGAVRPDLILRDLVYILQSTAPVPTDSLYYYIRVSDEK